MTPDNKPSLSRILDDAYRLAETLGDKGKSDQDVSLEFYTYLLNNGYPAERLERGNTAPYDVFDTQREIVLFFDQSARSSEPNEPIPQTPDLQFDYGQSWGREDFE